MNSKLKLLIIGPPGAGKGTIGSLISKEYNLSSLSTGEVLREEIKKETKLGILAKSLINEGKFVPDEVVSEIVKNKIVNMNNGFLIDGFPRNLTQTEIFDNMLKEDKLKLDRVIYLEVNKEILKERIINRIICPVCNETYNKISLKPIVEWKCDKCSHDLVQREDDKEEFIKTRLDIYDKNTKPLVNFYCKRGILETINASLSIEEQFNQIKKILNYL